MTSLPEILRSKRAQQAPVRRGHENRIEFSPPRILRRIRRRDVRSQRGRTGFHDVADCGFAIFLRLAAQDAEDDSALVYDYGERFFVPLETALHGSRWFIRRAGRDVAVGEPSDSRRLRQFSIERQVIGEPVQFTGDIIEDQLEAESFEPPRGSRTEVSLVVMAVDDNGFVLRQPRDGAAIEFP